MVRPQGHYFDRSAPTEKKPIVYGPSQALDYELEIGVIIGNGVSHLEGLSAKNADEKIFGFVILNDWSGENYHHKEGDMKLMLTEPHPASSRHPGM